MNRRISISAYLAVCLIAANLAGCISTNQVVPVATGSIATNSARIVVKRESAYAGSGAPMFIIDSGKQIGSIASGGELIWDRIAGPMELTAFYHHIGNGNPVPTRISVESGMSYLFMVSSSDGKHPSVQMVLGTPAATISASSASVIPSGNQNILGITVGPTSGVRGVRVITVASGSSCASVLKPGDTIFAFDLIGQGDLRVGGAKVNADNFQAEVSKILPGMTVKLLISLRPVVEVSCSMLQKPAAAQVTDGSTSVQAPGPSVQQTGTIPTGKAVIYIYRPNSPLFGADVKLPFPVKANGKLVTTLVQGGYAAYLTEPGQIEFTAFDSGFMAPSSIFSITLDAKAGQAYYLKGAHGKGMAGRAHLTLVTPEVGASEITNCKLIP